MKHENNGGIVLLSHAGTDLTALGRARWPQDFSPVSGIALQHIADEQQMQQLLDGQLSSARILLLRVLGRVQAIPGFDLLRQHAIARRQALIILSGTGEPDPELAALSTVPRPSSKMPMPICKPVAAAIWRS
jgi:cobaltochelatase CobN